MFRSQREQTEINGVWQYVVYDAFGKCVAEYGQLSDGVGGVKYVQQDWQAGLGRAAADRDAFEQVVREYEQDRWKPGRFGLN